MSLNQFTTEGKKGDGLSIDINNLLVQNIESKLIEVDTLECKTGNITSINTICANNDTLTLKPATKGIAGTVLSSLGNGSVDWVNNGNLGKCVNSATAPTISGTVEQSILNFPSFIGNLTFPANSLKVGETYSISLTGFFACVNNDILTLRLTMGGVQLAQISHTCSVTSGGVGVFEIVGVFTVLSLGGAGVASANSYFDLSYIANDGNMKGSRNNNLNNTGFNTQVSNTLNVTAQFNTTNAGNAIASRQMTLTQLY